jgi:hypothetical protein
LLLISTFFETYRGLWRLWFLTALWLIFLAACMWRVWGFAFIPGEGPGWRYVEAFGDYLKNIRTALSPTKVKNESQLLIFLKNHPIFIIILLLLLIVALLYFHISPFIFFIFLFISALLINYFLKEAFKSRGIILADKIPLSVGMTFIWMSMAMFFLLYLLFFVVKQIILG